MKQSVKYIVRGLYFGIGFSLIGFLALQATIMYNDSNREELEKELHEIFVGQERNMAIEVIETNNTNKGIITLLKVSNNNNKPVHSFRAEVEFFRENNKFIGECSSFIIKSIEPGSTENIEVFCEEKWKGWLSKISFSKAKFKNEHKSFNMFY